MATVNPTTWGPAFWKARYGFEDFDTFFEQSGPLLEGLALGPLRPPTESVARLAWYSPGSGPGVYVAGRLYDDGSGDGASPFAAWALAQLQAIQTEQDNTMATLIIPNAFQVSIEARVGIKSVFNVVGVTNAGGTAAGAAAAVKAEWEKVGGPLVGMSSLITMVNYRAVDLSSAFGDIADVASSASGTVTTGNSLATAGACALVQWNGGQRSRSTRGRLYHGPIMDAQVDPDGRTIPTATRNAIQGRFTQFRNGLASAGYPLAVLSRTTLTAYPISSETVEPILATQRRRIR